jgi:hypothetical protein
MTDTVDQIASNLVREGINKHKARELAVHFIGLVEMPEYPQTLSIADVDHANIEKPDTWTIEHFECWQREQVARENVRVLRRHIKELRQAMSPNPENDDTKSECVADVDEMSGWASVKNPTEFLDDLRGGADK